MRESFFPLRNSPFVRAIRQAYQAGQQDEALEPLIAVDREGRPVGRLCSGDSVIFYDLRGEREIELTASLTEKSFSRFPVEKNLNLDFTTMIEYQSSLGTRVAFPPQKRVANTFGEVVSRAGLRLLKITESEKAVHVGYFLNGKRESPFPGEERVIIPSPESSSAYTDVPELSAAKIAEVIAESAADHTFRVVVANLANIDVVGHTEDRAAVARAVKTVDRALGCVLEACRSHGLALVVTSDHGSVEEWLYPDGTINTGHTKNPVPFILADFTIPDPCLHRLRHRGELADVAPTLLELLGLRAPEEMTGRSLLLNSPRPDKDRRVLLLILDGWGMREDTKGNLFCEAATPQFDRIWSRFPSLRLEAAGETVGLPPHAVGNSEAGHLHLGAGRRILLDRVIIDRAIREGSFFENEALVGTVNEAKNKGRRLHLLGIVSHYSSHGSIHHLFALMELARRHGLRNTFIHCLLGRRGEKPESGAVYISKVEDRCKALGIGRVVTVMGRYWALDREENWGRVEKAYRALVSGRGTQVKIEGE